MDTTIEVFPLAPSNLLTTQTQSSLTLTWVDKLTYENRFTVQIATDKDLSLNSQTFTVAADVMQYMFYPLANLLFGLSVLREVC